MDQPGKVANPARGQLNREKNIPLSPCVRDGFSRPVPRQPAHLHTQAESGAYLRDSSRVPRRRPFMKPPYAIGSVPSLSSRAIAYRWRSLPRVRRHRASKPQGSSERVLPWQIIMDQLMFASLSILVGHLHFICYFVLLNNKYQFLSSRKVVIAIIIKYSIVQGSRIGNLTRLIHTLLYVMTIHTYIPPREDQCEWHRMTRMTGPDCVCMYVFIKLHITTQSGPVILVILCHSMYVCMYVCMYVFIKLHITTQSGPVILVILCHSH